MFSNRNRQEMIQICTSFFMMVTALHSTLQTPSRRTHFCFTQRRYHSLPQIRVSTRNSIITTCPKLFVAWRRHGLDNYCSCKAMVVALIPSHSHLMDPKLSRGLMTRPFEFGMQAPASRCSHPFEGMIARSLLSQSHPMDPKSSRGLMTRPFEFGTQAPASRYSHPSEGIMT